MASFGETRLRDWVWLCCVVCLLRVWRCWSRMLVRLRRQAVARARSRWRREFRGVWVATVENIDWPSKPGLPVDKQKQEFIAILDKCVELNINAVIFQIRPQADAFYDSKLEPWSEFLTGKMGKAPEPYYDPLKFAVEEAHRRGLQLHAWFNPYRVRVAKSKSEARPIMRAWRMRTSCGSMASY